MALRHGRHHPFLLDEYPFHKGRGGVTYYTNFSKLGLTQEYAPYISFAELLDVPTIGISSGQDKTFWELFDPDHARWLDAIINDGSRRIVFVSDGVIRRMQKARTMWEIFSWIPDHADHGVFYRIGETEVHKVHHFSSMGVHGQRSKMKWIIDKFCW